MMFWGQAFLLLVGQTCLLLVGQTFCLLVGQTFLSALRRSRRSFRPSARGSQECLPHQEHEHLPHRIWLTPMPTQTILVTGAAGFVGSRLSAALLSRGDRVVGLDNFNDYYPRVHKDRHLADLLPQKNF